jgi:hypothetical protein
VLCIEDVGGIGDAAGQGKLRLRRGAEPLHIRVWL